MAMDRTASPLNYFQGYWQRDGSDSQCAVSCK